MGFLQCQKCGGYYELQHNENPEDFSNECVCGGNLEYTKNIETSHEPTMLNCPKCLTNIMENTEYCHECGYKLYKDDLVDHPIIEDDLNRNPNLLKFNSTMKNSGILTIGLGGIYAFINPLAGLYTILLGVVLLSVKKVFILLLFQSLLIIFGLFNASYGNNIGYLQILLSLTFLFSWNKYRKLDMID